MSVKEYITSRHRFPVGPHPSCGEEAVLMAENIDLTFGDDEVLKFGDDSDVGIKWDGSNLTILPLTDDVGAVNIGDGATDMDFKVFLGETTKYVLFDVENSLLQLEDVDLKLGDGDILQFGDDNDVVIKWDASNLTILPKTDLTGAIQIGNGTLSMDLKVFGTESVNYFEYDASEDRLNLVIVTRTITGEDHALDIAYAGVCAAGGSDAMVGVNVSVTPSGDGGAWASAFFGKVNVAAAGPGAISGYFCGAEFEINISGGMPSSWGVLVLNANNDGSTYGMTEAYVWLREYGDSAVRNLFYFADHTRASESNSVIVSQTGSKPFDTAIRCTIGSPGTTGLWLLASSVGPADADIDFKMLGSGATNYIEYDASKDQLNIVVASRVITGKDIACDINFAGTVGSGDYMIGCRSQVTPTGAASAGGAVYAMPFQGIMTLSGANRSATGYACGAEFRMVMTGSADLPDHGVLVLAMHDDNTGSKAIVSPYIMLREYGTYAANAFVRFFDHTRASASDSVIVSQMPETPFDTAVRCMVGTTPIWLYGSTVGPASIADLKWIGSAATNYVEYDASGDVLNVVAADVTISGEHHALSVVHTGTLSSGENIVGVNVVVTPKGTGGNWAAAFYGKVVMTDANDPVPGTGYISAAEFEIVASSGVTPCDAMVLVLNSTMSNAAGNNVYIRMHDYGSVPMANFLWFYEHSRESASDAVIISQMPQTPFDTAIRCEIGSGPTAFWLYGSTVGPASIEDFKWIGSSASNYMEFDASADVFNVVVASLDISGEHHALEVAHTGTLSSGDSIVGVNAVVTPKGTAGNWASAFYGMVEITDANDSIPGTGYVSGAELEVKLGSGITPCNAAILVLNDSISCGHGVESAYIWLRKYGSTWPHCFVNFYEEDLGSLFNSGRMVVITAASPAANQLVRCLVGNTEFWLLATRTLPGS